MGQSIDCQPHFGHQVGRRKASYANHAAQVGEKTAVCLLSDRLLEEEVKQQREEFLELSRQLESPKKQHRQRSPHKKAEVKHGDTV